MAYLDDHPPARSQFRRPRRERPSGVIVVHTAENTPDFVAFDGGAEAVANFIRGRSDPGSYHDLCDSDSCINLVGYDAEAWQDGTGSNPHAYAVSVATRADVWPLAPQAWRDGAVLQAAAAARRYANWLRATTGIVIPARRINRGESENRIPGFISHAERDPARRTDPGRAFPWEQFLSAFAGGTPTPKDWFDMATEADLRRVVTEAKPAPGYFAVSTSNSPVTYYVAADHQSKLSLTRGGGLHKWIKDLHAVAHLETEPVIRPQAQLDEIPGAAVEDAFENERGRQLLADIVLDALELDRGQEALEAAVRTVLAEGTEQPE